MASATRCEISVSSRCAACTDSACSLRRTIKRSRCFASSSLNRCNSSFRANHLRFPEACRSNLLKSRCANKTDCRTDEVAPRPKPREPPLRASDASDTIPSEIRMLPTSLALALSGLPEALASSLTLAPASLPPPSPHANARPYNPKCPWSSANMLSSSSTTSFLETSATSSWLADPAARLLAPAEVALLRRWACSSSNATRLARTACNSW
mmetsp:Transcript_24250/g.61806  ORF Transcript_24250/g.61806 Transcript_24250/m.61806 type:complete len:211 (-) Transcript_24250:842-1474(-)